jgi:hypothetical protein
MVGGEKEMREDKVYLHGRRYVSGRAKVYAEVGIVPDIFPMGTMLFRFAHGAA